MRNLPVIYYSMNIDKNIAVPNVYGRWQRAAKEMEPGKSPDRKNQEPSPCGKARLLARRQRDRLQKDQIRVPYLVRKGKVGSGLL